MIVELYSPLMPYSAIFVLRHHSLRVDNRVDRDGFQFVEILIRTIQRITDWVDKILDHFRSAFEDMFGRTCDLSRDATIFGRSCKTPNNCHETENKVPDTGNF